MGNLDFSGLNKLGLYSAVVNGQVLTHIQDEVVYVNSEDDLTLLSDFKAGSFAMTYGLDTIWQKKPDGTWQEITGGSGGGGGGNEYMIVHITSESDVETFDTTFSDIKAAFNAGKNVVALFIPSDENSDTWSGSVVGVTETSGGQYEVGVIRYGYVQTYYASGEDGYPFYSFD